MYIRIILVGGALGFLGYALAADVYWPVRGAVKIGIIAIAALFLALAVRGMGQKKETDTKEDRRDDTGRS
jgi:hypothetical protein